ncbi:hypothetical protein RAZWK3B_20536 [Roseobacter sp. AzwK-3b]|jgi:uncharacterized protein YjiS (DUF1127 family)|uniref:DUF1127 domain-containing protein n=1 Tax=Roseobacter sp. AzwK-3b TaxID=351016 RepID=UPI0001569AD1|nr:DUF1127 domain-containing protein [Roseobacter sp. AzwK-3b]EDM71778.1 hypothetical protein RAZWK3B_20536 [Roseobacter sp. AzwK-3b]
MAVFTTNISDAPARLRDWLKTVGTALALGFEAHARRASRRDQIEALEAMSDVELARIGLRRDDIVRHVYGDLFYR